MYKQAKNEFNQIIQIKEPLITLKENVIFKQNTFFKIAQIWKTTRTAKRVKCHKGNISRVQKWWKLPFCGGRKTRAKNSNCWQGDVSSKSYWESRNDSVLARDPERNDTEWLQCSVSGGKYADKGQWISFKSKPSINPARERHGSYWSVGRLKSTPSFLLPFLLMGCHSNTHRGAVRLCEKSVSIPCAA